MANRFWIPAGTTGSGTWNANDTTHWSVESNGAGGASAPTSADDVFFDASSITAVSQVITIGAGAVCKSMNFTGVLNSPDLHIDENLTVSGNITFAAGMTVSGVAYLQIDTVCLLTTAGITIGCEYIEVITGGNLSLVDELNVKNIAVNDATFNSAGFDINCEDFEFYDGSTITIDGSTITVGGGYIYGCIQGGTDVSAIGATIIIPAGGSLDIDDFNETGLQNTIAGSAGSKCTFNLDPTVIVSAAAGIQRSTFTNVTVTGLVFDATDISNINGGGNTGITFGKEINASLSFSPQFNSQLYNTGVHIDGSLSFSPQMQGLLYNIQKTINGNLSFSPQIQGLLEDVSNDVSGSLTIILPVLQFNAYGGGYLNITLPTIIFTAQGSVEPVGQLLITLPRLQFSVHAVQETLGQLNTILPALRFTANGIISPIGQLNIILPRLGFTAHGLNGVVGTINATLPSLTFRASTWQTGFNTLYITLPKIQFSMRARSNDVIVLVLNTKNFALTEYDNTYNYNSLFNFNGKLVGLKRDGVYELNGDTDDGESIDWYFKTGKFDLEEGQLKKARYIWLSYRPSGDLVLTVDDGENEYEYSVESYKQVDNSVRIKLGKGIRNRYIQLELRNVSNEKIFLDRMRLFTEPIAKKR